MTLEFWQFKRYGDKKLVLVSTIVEFLKNRGDYFEQVEFYKNFLGIYINTRGGCAASPPKMILCPNAGRVYNFISSHLNRGPESSDDDLNNLILGLGIDLIKKKDLQRLLPRASRTISEGRLDEPSSYKLITMTPGGCSMRISGILVPPSIGLEILESYK